MRVAGTVAVAVAAVLLGMLIAWNPFDDECSSSLEWLELHWTISIMVVLVSVLCGAVAAPKTLMDPSNATRRMYATKRFL